ncbi:hypothetical protein C9J48_27390 [Photobacterium profundum]|uniref:Phage related protein n=1 Tax=Photobacterium profundum 3TCK TaxID=314280 RepID=Q1YVT3_9GAMM|nr:DUF3693 domain-containing protein [Photobacterium profundum]EAS40402.1 hypothetical protein P3TCK_19905 [Photobacterium profundum 3TCK]PSV56699.1 hypothetical protein C9J48_27390 [Photobacterium profundum]
MYQTKLLDSYKSAKNYIQDKQIAADLGVQKSRISEFRSGKRYMSDIQAVFLAQECKIDEKEALIGVHADRTQNSHIKQLWDEIAKKLNSQGNQLHSLGLVAILGGLSTEVKAVAQCALCLLYGK